MQNVDVDEFHCALYQARMTPEQCRAARGWLDWKQSDLAIAATVGLSTIRDFEAGKRTPIAATMGAMKAALELRGIVFGESEPLGISYNKPNAKR